MIIEIYTKEGCIYCSRAKNFLVEKGLVYSEYILGKDFTKEFIVENFPHAKTYPIILVDGTNIGGYESLVSNFNTMNEISSNSLRYLAEESK
jgi:glutaredoxin 3